MKPLKLTMQAFGSYGKKTTIDFEKPNQNLFLITGDTGAGKSTVFDAIVFAIYGEASSGTNKKNGVELQSQFADLGTEPCVELTFSENFGTYIVRRIPKHQRPLKRGKGVKDESSSVSLIMPDGSEYPQKETDEKLREIVGLTKNQFMQIAMIAQGEFMELLRAKSDDKRKIFRKLFHTELFQNIVEELGQRKKEKEDEINKIKTACQMETSRVVIPEEYKDREKLSELKKRIEDGEVAIIRDFFDELGQLCEQLEKEKQSAEKRYEKADKMRDEKRDLYKNAEDILKFFEQLESANAELAECQKQEAEMEKAEILIKKLRDAYETKAVYERYREATEAVCYTKISLKKQQDALPDFEKTVENETIKEVEAKRSLEEELKLFGTISGKVSKAKELFAEVRKREREVAARQEIFEKTRNTFNAKQSKLEELEKRETIWKTQWEELKDVEKDYAQWEIKNSEASSFVEASKEAVELESDVRNQREKAETSKCKYQVSSEKYQRENQKYEELRRAFFDAQAGFLAGELESGKPCPVCGSLEHPHPCRQREEYAGLTKEVVDTQAEEVKKLRDLQELAAAESESDRKLYHEKENRLKDSLEKLYSRLQKSVSNLPKELDLRQMQKTSAEWKKTVEKEGTQIAQKVKKQKKIQDSLDSINGKKQQLREGVETAREEATNAEKILERETATLTSLKNSGEYATEKDADIALQEAEERKGQKDKSYQEIAISAAKAKEEKEQCQALILKYSQELPNQREKCFQTKNEYEQLMSQKNLAESEWKEFTEKYDRQKEDELRERVKKHGVKKATAEDRKRTAKEAIGARPRPDIEIAKQEMNEAEERLQEEREYLEQYKRYYESNAEVCKVLAPYLSEREKMIQEHSKLDALYKALSGNVSGSRMDIETYVQRYHLEKILYAANRRFQDMSAGQFELRMCREERAGDGKNRGLDLMVYSTVTGKEREVRTLSGGESFMAALSLALGMADQIQEHSAALNLDIMFIDEGFGALDEHSRNQAVKVLKQMAGGSKLVGIISHVTELKQEIEDQLIVGKDENGSYVRWQIS